MGGLFAGQPAEPFPDAVFDRFMSVACAPDYREVLTLALGDTSVERAQRESAYFFTDEVAAAGGWPFGPKEAARIGCPTVVVGGSASPPPVQDAAAPLAAWLPTASIETIAGGDHLLPLRRPSVVAARIAALAAAAEQ